MSKNSSKAKANQTVRRRLRIIDMMNNFPKTSQQITEKLNNEGIDVGLRTVQDDLKDLSYEMPHHISQRDEGNLYSYRRPKTSYTNTRKNSQMSPQEAITFEIALSYLRPLLPSKSLDDLDPYLKEAKAVLSDNSAGRMRNWKNKVLTVNEGLQLELAPIKKNVLKNIHIALWEEKTINAMYTSKNKTFPSKYHIHPAGLVYRGRICYLICSFENNNEKIVYLPLHRFESIKVRDDEYSRHRKHKVEPLAKDLIGFRVSDKKIKIKLKFTKQAGSHLYETPISQNQKASISKDGFIIIEDTVTDDMELRFWIRGFGDSVEVIKPKKLRDEFKTIAKRMNKLYE
jgi:predicted DNA-binding transcriptional regulator YafY